LGEELKIYDAIIKFGKLSEEHKNELKTKRGFTEETISKNKFFSGGQYLLKHEDSLLKDYSEQELLDSGTFIKPDRDPHLSPLLQENRIIIPYLDKEGCAYNLRPHKLGLKGVPVQIYQDAFAGDNLVLTEGEFKAAAAVQLGFNCVAIPGIGSFSDKHFDRLTQFLDIHKVKDICIIFDNEIKDDPKYKSYKKNPTNRYDTQYYMYFMAKKLNKAGYRCKIGMLPDNWRQDGKIDIDGALAMGKSRSDFCKIVSESIDHKQFLSQLPSEIRNIILKKEKRSYHRSRVRKEFGCYVVNRGTGEKAYEERISNFTIEIVATHRTYEGMIREVRFTNEYGEQSNSFALEADYMNSADSFGAFCLRKGNYIWRGRKEDLSNIWESLFLDDDGRVIIEPDHIGWLENERMFIFGNVSITHDGKEMRPDGNHIFWTEKRGIKPITLGVAQGRRNISEGMPYLHLKEFDVNIVRERLAETISDKYASMCLGWITAVVYMEDVFKKYGCFPFLFINGKRASGKSTVAEWLMNFYGLENSGKMAADTTAVGIQRYLAYYSSLPVYIDEYRNTKKVTDKNGFLRNCYNRQSAGKGVKSDFGVREAKIRGTLLIAGEETPEDNALRTRCVIAYVSLNNRKVVDSQHVNHFDWFQANRLKFSAHILKIIRNKHKTTEKFIEILDEGKQYLVENGADDRIAINYAVVAAGYAMAFDEDVEFAQWISAETSRAKDVNNEEQAVQVFIEELNVLKTRKLVNKDFWELDEGKIYIYFQGLYQVWSIEFKKSRGVEPFKSSAIRDYLKEESGFISLNEPKRINGQLKKCIVFEESNAPEGLRMLVDELKPEYEKKQEQQLNY